MKLKNLIFSIISMSIFLALAILATFYEIFWAKNLIYFLSPIILLIAIVVFFGIDLLREREPEKFNEALNKLKAMEFFRPIIQLFYLSMIFIFVSHGWFFSATCWALIWFFAYLNRSKMLTY